MVDNDDENKFVFDFAKENDIHVWIGILERVKTSKYSFSRIFHTPSKQDLNYSSSLES